MTPNSSVDIDTQEIIVSQTDIGLTLDALALQIALHYGPLVKDVQFTIVLEGARRFGHDLLKRLPDQPQVNYCNATSYQGTSSTGSVSIEGIDTNQIKNKSILIVDDIYDTGRTLTALKEYLTDHGAADVKIAVLLEKQHPHEFPLHIDFIGRQVPNLFLIGYGLDHNGRYRDLNEITALSEN
jgi:hypoxanthine phosphoribosyltransferase